MSDLPVSWMPTYFGCMSPCICAHEPVHLARRTCGFCDIQLARMWVCANDPATSYQRVHSLEHMQLNTSGHNNRARCACSNVAPLQTHAPGSHFKNCRGVRCVWL